MSDKKKFIYLTAAFAAAYFVPFGHPRVTGALAESALTLQVYAREHVLTCLIPAFFIAGGIAVFVSQASVIRYLGAGAGKALAYGTASVSGSVLAVCSCTVLPLFAGLYQRGAGIGPATAFLYAGPAINVLAIILTARVLGLRMGLARAIGAVTFAIVIGIAMATFFHGDEKRRAGQHAVATIDPERSRSLWKDLVYFGLMVLTLIFASWGRPAQAAGFWSAIYGIKWILATGALVALLLILRLWFDRDELGEWMAETAHFALLIMPLLIIGVLAAGFLLGRPGHEALISTRYVEAVVGERPDWFFALTGLGPGVLRDGLDVLWPVWTCLFASVAGAFMYFATLTEIPILESLMEAGMDEGPALALLLAGPAVSLPNMLVIRGVLGTRKAAVYVAMVAAMSTIAGVLYGSFFAG